MEIDRATSQPMYRSEDQTEMAVLSLWSWPEGKGAEVFYPMIVQIFNELGIAPDKGVMGSEEWGKLKTLKAKTVAKRMEENKARLNWLGLHKTKNTNNQLGVGNEYDNYFIHIKCRDTLRSITLGFEGRQEYYNEIYFNSIVKRVSAVVRPCYGFATKIPQWQRPLFHVLGVGEGGQGMRFRPELETRTRDWAGDIHIQRHCKDQIRDLYEFNYIGRSHLDSEFKINGRSMRFGDYIEESKVGSLKQVTKYLWCWNMPPKKLNDIRKILMNSGKLLVTI